MDSDNQLVSYCEDDGEYRVYCDACDNLCIERYFKIHKKSQTHMNNYRKRQQSKKAFQLISFNNL